MGTAILIFACLLGAVSIYAFVRAVVVGRKLD